ncbi:MAG: DUF2723 domain-containing protein, partial [Kiritimatiellae bacterium]|nr:DUF2723 domain-containing protein [Kiritimatiellia bacterium]
MTSSRSVDRWIGVGCALLLLVVYLTTIHAFAQPGEPASQLVRHLGLIPRQTPSHPLWSLVVALVARIPGGGIALRVAVVSAVCGALVAWLLYETVAGAIFAVIEKNPSNTRRAVIASRLAGVSAVLFLGFSTPFWV